MAEHPILPLVFLWASVIKQPPEKAGFRRPALSGLVIEERPQEPELRLILDVVARVAKEGEKPVFRRSWTRIAVVQGQWRNPECTGAALLCFLLILMAPDGKETGPHARRSPLLVVEREWADAQHADGPFLDLMVPEVTP